MDMVISMATERTDFKSMIKLRKDLFDNLDACVLEDDSYFDEVEEILIGADIGVHEAIEIVNATKAQAKIDNITEPQKINDIVIDKIYISYVKNDDIESEVNWDEYWGTVSQYFVTVRYF